VLVDAAIAAQYFVALYALSLPAQVYADFVRPRRAGLSAQSFGAWLVDDLLNWGVLTLFYLVGVLVIYRFIRRLPKAWPLGALGAYVVLSSLYVVLMPNVIEPLTHDFKPLPESTRKQAIMVLALANGIEHPNVVVSNASAKSRLLNAHVSGVGATTRITINDNALSETSDAMLLAVVAHEIGHFVLSHTAMSIVTDSLVSGAGFLFIAIGTGWMVRRYGRRWQIDGMGDMTSLPVFWGLFVLWGFLSLPASNAISRLYERQADLFALNASRSPHGLAEFMIHDGDTRRIAPTAAEYALFYTHPSAAERVFASMKWRAQMSAVQPGR
jgi:STE24 endopeptidase